MLFAAWETANTFASDICAASSINSTSTLRRASGRAQNQEVPPPTAQSDPTHREQASFSVVNCRVGRSSSLSETF